MLTIPELKFLQKEFLEKEKTGEVVNWNILIEHLKEFDTWLRIKILEIIKPYEEKGVKISCIPRLEWQEDIKKENWYPHILFLSITRLSDNKIWMYDHGLRKFISFDSWNILRTIYSIGNDSLPINDSDFGDVICNLDNLLKTEICDARVRNKYEDLQFLDFENIRLLLGKETKLLDEGDFTNTKFHDSFLIVEINNKIHIFYSFVLVENDNLFSNILENKTFDEFKNLCKHIQPKNIKQLEYFFQYCEENNDSKIKTLREKWEQKILKSWE